MNKNNRFFQVGVIVVMCVSSFTILLGRENCSGFLTNR